MTLKKAIVPQRGKSGDTRDDSKKRAFTSADTKYKGCFAAGWQKEGGGGIAKTPGDKKPDALPRIK